MSDELAAAGKPRFPTLAEAEEIMRTTAGKWVPQGVCALVMAEFDRMRAELEFRNRQAQNDTTLLIRAGIQVTDLERDLARALPVVEAAGVLVDEWHYHPQEGSPNADSNEAHFEVLEAAVLAARAVDAGKGE